jgi:hypothetical protein
LVEGTSITRDGLEFLLPSRSLTALNIGGCPNLSEDDLIEVLPRFSRLRKLELPNTVLGTEVAQAVATLTNLTDLRLSGPSVTDAVLADLAPLSRLELLHLFSTEVTIEGMDTFKSAHPNCKIQP